MAKSYRYKLNKYSHEVLGKLFFKFSPFIRRSGQWDDSDRILESELYINDAFTSFSVDEIREELKITDVQMQDLCEYLELNKDIEPTQISPKGIFQKIKATKHGYKAFKFETYIEKNKSLTYEKKFKNSTLLNNFITPFIALVAAGFAVAGYYKNPDVSVQLKLPEGYKLQESNTQPNTHQISLFHEKNEKNYSYIDTLKVKK